MNAAGSAGGRLLLTLCTAPACAGRPRGPAGPTVIAIANSLPDSRIGSDEAVRRGLDGNGPRIIAEVALSVPLGPRTNVAIYQPDVDGVGRPASGDFDFLCNVRRTEATRR